MRLPIYSDTGAPLAAMWHAYRLAQRVPQNRAGSCTSVVHALLQARYYDFSRGQFSSEDPIKLFGLLGSKQGRSNYQNESERGLSRPPSSSIRTHMPAES